MQSTLGTYVILKRQCDRTWQVFCRTVVAIGKQDAGLPWLVFLQGGPGGASRVNIRSSLIAAQLNHFKQCFLPYSGAAVLKWQSDLSLGASPRPANSGWMTSALAKYRACPAMGGAAPFGRRALNALYGESNGMRYAAPE